MAVLSCKSLIYFERRKWNNNKNTKGMKRNEERERTDEIYRMREDARERTRQITVFRSFVVTDEHILMLQREHGGLGTKRDGTQQLACFYFLRQLPD